LGVYCSGLYYEVNVCHAFHYECMLTSLVIRAMITEILVPSRIPGRRLNEEGREHFFEVSPNTLFVMKLTPNFTLHNSSIRRATFQLNTTVIIK
jgi:hypothetical protein